MNNNDNFSILNERKEYEELENAEINESDFFNFLNWIQMKLDNGIKKVLIYGTKIFKRYDQINGFFPNANFYITNSDILNLEEGRSLLNFYLKHGKWDLIIFDNCLSGLSNNTKRRSVIKFVYKHFMRKKSIFCIVEKEFTGIYRIFKNLRKVDRIQRANIHLNSNSLTNQCYIIIKSKNKERAAY